MEKNSKDEKTVQSGDEAVDNGAKKTTAKTEKSTAKKKTEKSAPKKMKKTREECIIRDSETAKKLGRNGGIKSGEVRRAKRDARDTIQYMLGRMTTSQNIRDNLKELGFEAEEFSNMAALHGRLFSMAMGGNLDAYLLLMRMGGYEPEENRKERESVASNNRKDMEVNAKLKVLGDNPDANVSLNMNDEEGHTDVVIYMPQIMSEESCEVKDENTENDKTNIDK